MEICGMCVCMWTHITHAVRVWGCMQYIAVYKSHERPLSLPWSGVSPGGRENCMLVHIVLTYGPFYNTLTY